MENYHYKHKPYFMTKTEHDFFKLLVATLGRGYYVFPQVHLGTITNPSVRWTYRWGLWRMAFFFSDKYSVDYVICDTGGIKPKLVIELDDKSHLREKRRGRDAFVEKVLQEANLHLVRIPVADATNVELIKARVGQYLLVA